jgi:hypothetical protein
MGDSIAAKLYKVAARHYMLKHQNCGNMYELRKIRTLVLRSAYTYK